MSICDVLVSARDGCHDRCSVPRAHQHAGAHPHPHLRSSGSERAVHGAARSVQRHSHLLLHRRTAHRPTNGQCCSIWLPQVAKQGWPAHRFYTCLLKRIRVTGLVGFSVVGRFCFRVVVFTAAVLYIGCHLKANVYSSMSLSDVVSRI
jgi:hypothetical protein